MNKKQAKYLYDEVVTALPPRADSGDILNAAAGHQGEANRGATLYLKKGKFHIKSAVVIPENVDLCFEEGAILICDEGGSFEFNGKCITAPDRRIFDSPKGLKGFRRAVFGRPEWFGAEPGGKKDCSEAVSAAANLFPTVWFRPDVYLLNKTAAASLRKEKNVLLLEGAGTGKTVIKIAGGVTGFDIRTEKGAVNNAVTVKNLSFEEVGQGKTATALSIQVADVRVEKCDFKGFDRAFETHNSGWVHYIENYSENNNVACEIKEHSMFLYYKFCHSVRDGKFLYCEIPPNGGYSNGIDVNGCLIEDSLECGVYTTENQAVFIDDCAIRNCRGAAGIYCGKDFDVSVSNCEITGAPDNKDFTAIKSVSSHSQYISNNYIDGCAVGYYLEGPYDWRSMTAVDGNVFKNCRENYFKIKCVNDYKIFNNIYDGALPADKEIAVETSLNGVYRGNKAGDVSGHRMGGLFEHFAATPKNAFSVSSARTDKEKPFEGPGIYEYMNDRPADFVLIDENDFETIVGNKYPTPVCFRLKRGIYRIEKDTVIDGSISLWFERGALIRVSEAATLTIKADKLYAGPYRIFEGGKVVAEKFDFAFAEWFGDIESDADATDIIKTALATCGRIFLPGCDMILDGEIELPAGKNVLICGPDVKHTVVHVPPSGRIFGFRGAGELSVMFKNIMFLGTEPCKGADFFGAKMGDKGRVVTDNVIFQFMNKIFELEGCPDFYSYLSRNHAIETYFDFKKSRNALFDSLLDPPGCGRFLNAKDCSDFTLYNIASVSGHSVDLLFKNSKNIIVKQGGLDASYYRTPEEYRTSYASADFNGCENVLVEGHWVANHVTPPGWKPSEYESVKRDNLRFTDCKKVTVAGNSIVNGRNAVTVERCSDVTIVGNKGEASLLHDFLLKNSEKVTLEYNFCLSFAWRGTQKELYLSRLKRSSISYNAMGCKEYKLEPGVEKNVVRGNVFSVAAGNPADLLGQCGVPVTDAKKEKKE